jgi:serine/threonine protein phosphatase PrpC
MCGDEALIAHVGDSRTYLLREGLLTQLTEDHSVAETMRRAGTMDDATAAVSPMRSVLSNAIGVTPTVTVDLLAVALQPGDRLLMCSDGLHDYFTREEVGLHLTGRAPTIGLARLIEQARARGGHDNITGVVFEARGRAAATAPIVVANPDDGDDVDDGEVATADDDATTNPVAVPLPLSGVSDVSVANFVDRSLREHSPHLLPPRRR